jgi:HlyD family secretion protein
VVSRNITQGQTVAASFQTPTLFVIATDLTQMQVDASVSESDIGDVVEGDKASFTVEAFPDRIFNGRVVQVRQAPQTVQNVVTYDVVVAVDNPKLLLKPGMTAAAHIITQSHEDVLRVPGPALRYMPAAVPGRAREHESPSEIWVLRDGKPLAIPVSIGLNDESYAEITRGDLKPNDQVIVAERASGTDTVALGPGQIAPRAPRL